MMKSRVNYWFDTFEHLNSFDIVPYQDVVDLYLKNQSLLDKSGKEKLGGDNERPINSDIEKLDNNKFWSGFNPRYLFLAHTKSDVPIFVQYPKLNGKEIQGDWDIKLEKNFKDKSLMRINIKNKTIKFL